MTIVKSNVCKSCGGLLDIDLDRQVYVCQFCGVTYDYEYFREDNVLEVGAKALAAGEFNSAREAYEFMLKKDPHNREALLGLFLCDCKWRSIDNLNSYTKVHLKEEQPALTHAVENCLPEDKEFFTGIQDALNILDSYRKKKDEIGKLKRDRQSEAEIYNKYKNEFNVLNRSFYDHICSFITFLSEDNSGKIVVAIAIFLLILFAFNWLKGTIITAAILIVVYTVIRTVMKNRKKKEISGLMERSWNRLNELSDEVAKASDEAEDLRNKYIDLAIKITA